ncbi:hypothetical protein [Gelatiniphilus marinus]|uniref:Plastocyanin-like domain-containing protein n=1 Tax=Gelatiniphilus marinus TaxID=1759464 RepID=A0ABW5JS49_9FLAO
MPCNIVGHGPNLVPDGAERLSVFAKFWFSIEQRVAISGATVTYHMHFDGIGGDMHSVNVYNGKSY